MIKNGKVEEEGFKIGKEVVPTVSEKSEKGLGKFFNDSLSDKQNVREICKQLDDWMKTVEKSGLPGKYKACIYQHGKLSRLVWPLLLYDVPVTTVKTTATSYSRRWLVFTF